MGKTTVYESIRQAILTGQLTPGQSITEEGLSETFHVSRTPVREALIRLEAEGVVRILKNKGAFVPELTALDIAEVFDLRILLEGHAARRCVPFIPRAAAEEFLGRLQHLAGDETKREEMAEVGLEIHNLIVASAQNTRLSRMIEILRSQIVWVHSYAAMIPGRIDKSLQEHVEILQAILDRDADRAETAMRRHLENTMHEVLSAANLPLLSALTR